MSGKKGSKWGNSEETFLEIISSIFEDENGCKLWSLGKDKDGYGYYSIKGKMYIAHRLLYKLLNPVKNLLDLVIMHSCDVRSCVNINHLNIGTASENTKDMIQKNRHVKGSLVGTSKLNEDQVAKIREMYPSKNCIELAKEFGVCKQTICNALNLITFVNASYVNEKYEPVNKPIRVIL